MKKILYLILCISLLATVMFGMPVCCNANEKNDEHCITDQTITAEELVNRITVGWNLGNSFSCAYYTDTKGYDLNLEQEMKWGNPKVTKELIDYVASTGINTIRIQVTWSYNTGIDGKGNLIIGKKWLARVGEVIQYCLDNDMFVIINTCLEHDYFCAGVSDEEMAICLMNVNQLWFQIADYFKNYDERLIFEAFNEIDNSDASWRYGYNAVYQMNQLNQMFVDTVRSTGMKNTTRNLIVPTLMQRAYDDRILDGFVLPKDIVSNHLLASVHCYTKRFDQSLEDNLNLLDSFSHSIGVPVIIGEFGVQQKTYDSQMRCVYIANFISRANSHNIKCFIWDNGVMNDYGIINREDFKESDINLIQYMMLGVDGLFFENAKNVHLYRKEDFAFHYPDLKTGEFKVSNWGMITNKDAYMVDEGNSYLISLSGKGSVNDMWVTKIAFYDLNDKYICGNEEKVVMERIVTAPKGAKKMYVTITNPYINIKTKEYIKYLNNGLLDLYIEPICYEKLLFKME